MPEPDRTARRDGLSVCLLLLALLRPFADRAFHIDDAFSRVPLERFEFYQVAPARP